MMKKNSKIDTFLITLRGSESNNCRQIDTFCDRIAKRRTVLQMCQSFMDTWIHAYIHHTYTQKNYWITTRRQQ